MFKTQFKTQSILILICLFFIFKTSVVQADDRTSDNDRARSNAENMCGDNLSYKFNPETLRTATSEDIQRYAEILKSNSQIAQLLRQRFNDPENPINPKETHIPELANLVDPHINFIEKMIQFQNFADKHYRLYNLAESLKPSAKAHQEAQGVTYEWFIRFSVSLAALVVGEHNWMEYYERPDIVNMWLENFPQIIMIPTTISIPEDETMFYFLLRINQDGNARVQSFDDAFIHFHHHDISFTNIINTQHTATGQFNSLFIQKIADLPKAQREKIEYIYFQLLHRPFLFSGSWENNPLRSNANNREELEAFIRSNIDMAEVDASGITLFVNLVLEIKAELAQAEAV